MKKIAIILVIIISTAFIISEAYQNAPKNTKKNETQKVSNDKPIGVPKVLYKEGDGHSQEKLDCRSCHLCEYPTKDDPCLIACPRIGMVSINHTPDEGPESVIMNKNGERYGKLVFSHKLHAEMAEMKDGCNSCHHYNTTGPILPCANCHSHKRKRDDVGTPDYRAAIHRQCMDCHKEWDKQIKCVSCHLQKGDQADKKAEDEIRRLKGLSHPPVKAPEKVLYETNYEKGRMVTFFHNDHTKLFGLNCISCHKDESCTKCHHTTAGTLVTKKERLQLARTEEEQHRACFICHKDDNCNKCHLKKEMQPFNHVLTTGFDLSKNHSSLTCNACHKSNNYTGLRRNCTSCHGDFKEGKFNHSRTGLALDANHNELECSSCHTENDFSKKPVCADCHDDISFPSKLPGKLTGTKK